MDTSLVGQRWHPYLIIEVLLVSLRSASTSMRKLEVGALALLFYSA